MRVEDLFYGPLKRKLVNIPMTWVSNDGVTKNQIDHVVIDERR